MNGIVFDVETTHTAKANGSSTPLPYFGNRLVSIGWRKLRHDHIHYDCYSHSTEPPTPDAFTKFQDALNCCDILVGHNIKFDLQWIRACGFTYEGEIYDTMVTEYILSRARRWPLGLAALAEKYDVTKKEKDLVKPYLEKGVTFYDIPWEVVEEYGRADVQATHEIALRQLDALGTTYGDIYADKEWANPDFEAVT